MRVGFIGTGNIGNPMAENLIKAGHSLVVHDLVEERAANLIELGARWAGSPSEAARQSEVVLTSLPGPAEVEAVLTGEDGILAGAAPGTAYFDLSTNLPRTVRRLAAVAAEQGVTMLDSPVSGGVCGAREATLAVMVGGDRAVFDAHRPLLEAIGKNVFYMGELGSGALIKLANNLVALSVRQVVQEGLVLAAKNGVDAERAHEVLSASSASAHMGGVGRLLQRQFDDPTFALTLAAKDVGLALQVAEQCDLSLPLASAAHGNLLRARALGLGGKSPEATLLVYEQGAAGG